MARRWIINGRFLLGPMTGVQRYAHETVGALDALVAEQHPLARGLELEILGPPGAEMSRRPEAIAIRSVGRFGGHAWEQAVLPAILNGGGLLSLCNTGPLMAGKHIVCMHDANTWNAPQSYSPSFRALYRTLLPALGRRASKVATVSAYSRGEIARHRIASHERTFVAANGHEHALRWTPCHSEATRVAASPATVVLIGSSVPHKNTDFILGMAKRLGDAGLRIAVVGQADPRVFKASASMPDLPNVFWLGRISDAELAALLQDSMCLAFPSLTEGFGLPVLEAMAIGCPVVSSDRASLPEVCGNAAAYAQPDDADTWLDRLVELKSSRRLRLQMIAKGKARSARFRWRDTALQYLRAMAMTDGLNPEFGSVADKVSRH